MIKAEVGFLREQWEKILLEKGEARMTKRDALEALSGILLKMAGTDDELTRDLVDLQDRFLDLSMAPERAENWVSLQIERRWNDLLERKHIPQEEIENIHNGDLSIRMGWPWHYWGLEPVDKKRPDWKIRYASVFQLS